MLTFANVDGVKTMPGLVPTLSQFTNIVCRVDEKHGVMEDLPDPLPPRKYLPFFHGWAGAGQERKLAPAGWGRDLARKKPRLVLAVR